VREIKVKVMEGVKTREHWRENDGAKINGNIGN
jgi:hypothetical protein